LGFSLRYRREQFGAAFKRGLADGEVPGNDEGARLEIAALLHVFQKQARGLLADAVQVQVHGGQAGLNHRS
jgi:hypothetical protein